MQLLHHRQSLPGSVGNHVGVREPVLLELSVKNFDLQLKGGGIRGAPDDRLFVTDTSFTQSGVSNAREMIAAEHVAELVLVAKPLVPVGVEEKVFRARSRPPRLLEVVVEIG